jgi:5-methylcytosine-specific restriction endonuclease McrA
METKLARKQGRLKCRDSFITTKGDLRLAGQDMQKLRELVYERDDGKCAECGVLTFWNAPPWSLLRAELHHVIPRSLGGEDSEANCVILCREHHRGPTGRHK